MPTAAKLIAAVAFGVLGVLLALVYIPGLPEGSQIGWLRETSAVIGLLCGWFVMGRLTGRRYAESMSTGVRTSVTVVFWVLLVFSIYVMVQRSTKMLYDGPMEAVLAVFDLMLGYGRLMLNTEFISTILVGGLIGGAVSEYAGRRWS